EQRTENPRVGGSNPPLGTIIRNTPYFLLRCRGCLYRCGSRHRIAVFAIGRATEGCRFGC
ncbi:MAG: hypothetical protein P8Y82_11535, partial [Methyloceanibacter sp.]